MSRKALLRRELLAARRLLTREDVENAAVVLSRNALSLPELSGARTVAAYVSVGTEPGTRALLDALRARGCGCCCRCSSRTTIWTGRRTKGPGTSSSCGRGLLEPDGNPLGREAVLEADAVLLPGLAVDARGMRLGRGGGSYDRVLARLAAAGAHPALIVLLYDDEVVAQVPEEPHDHPVDVVVTPAASRRTSR